jgi:hypothetical protein
MSDFTLTFGDPLRVSVTVPEGATQVALSTSDSNVVVVQNALAVTGGTGAAGAGVPVGGTTGQSLVKLTNADYSTEWADRLASVVDDTSPELGGDLNTAGNAITFEDGGNLSYSNSKNTLVYTNADGVSIELGEKNVFYGKAAEAISKGDVVMFGGVQGNHLLLKKADQQASGFMPEWVIGFAAQDLSTNDWGYAVWFGVLDGLSGYDEATYSEGDLLYLDPATPGAVRLSEPTPPNHSILLAAVLKPNNGNAGKIIIRPTHKPDTDEVPEGSTNLYYTAARAQADVPTLKTSDLTLDDATRVVNLLAGGRITFRDSANNPLLYIDESNAYVGVGNVTPTAGLHVAADARIGNNLRVGGPEVRLANSSTIGVLGGERFTIGKITGSGAAVITINGVVNVSDTFQIGNTTGIQFSGAAGNSLGASTLGDFSFTKNGSGSANYKFDDQVSEVSFENTTSVNLKDQLPLRLYDSDSSNYVGIQPPATVAADYTLTLPADDGDADQVLTTDGSGALSWTTPVSDSIYTADGTLSGNRAIELNGNTLELTQGGASQVKFFSTGNAQINNRLTIDGDTSNSSIRMWDNGNSNAVTINTSSSMSGSVSVTLPTTNLTFPTSAGSAGDFIKTDGSGNLSFANPITTYGGGTFSWSGFDAAFKSVSPPGSISTTLFNYAEIDADPDVTISDTMVGPSVSLGDAADATRGTQNTLDIRNIPSGRLVEISTVLSFNANGTWLASWGSPGSPYGGGTAAYVGMAATSGYEDVTFDLSDFTTNNIHQIKQYLQITPVGASSVRWRWKSLTITIS